MSRLADHYPAGCVDPEAQWRQWGVEVRYKLLVLLEHLDVI